MHLILWGLLLFFCSSAFALEESTGSDGSNVQAVHQLGYTGQGVKVGLLGADNTRYTHEAFKDVNGISHAFAYDFTGDGYGITYSSHDTAMAGIVCSRGGVSHPNDIGVAPGADIYNGRIVASIDGNDIIYLSYVTDALEEFVNNQGCRVIVSGIQLSSTADGQGIFTMLYDYYAYNYDVVFANASGNDSSGITVFGDAFNGITTGGLAVTDPNVYRQVGSRSNPGPTVDGRSKPEVVAPSDYQTMPYAGTDTQWYERTSGGGVTSYAVPHTAGVAALLISFANNTGEPNDGHNEVIKAVIVNSVFPNIDDKAGSSTNPADVNNVWNADRGYGRLDALRAWQILSADRIEHNVATATNKGWAYESLSAGQDHNYTIEGIKNERLVATLTWNRRIIWNDKQYPSSGRGIIEDGELVGYLADLDVEIRDPNGVLLNSNPSTIDNLEKIDLLLTKSGTYEIKVANQSTNESADYALAFELLPSITGDLSLDYIVDGRDLRLFAQQWLNEGLGLAGDIEPDEIVNFSDFVQLGTNWMAVDERYWAE